jgi:site-specific DNA-methyltransferase (adenine-specific)
MEIIYKKVSELIPYVNNPRKNDKSVDSVASSIKNFGFKVPIVIDSKGEIVTGHTRIKASKKLGLTEVPCIVADDLSDAQIKAFRIADNRVGEESDWDFNLLKIELDSIQDIDLDFLNFDNMDNMFSDAIPMDCYDTRDYANEHFLVTFDKDDLKNMEKFINFLEENGWEYEQSHN